MKTLILLSLIVLSGCASLPYYSTISNRQEYLSNNPDTPEDIKKLILNQQYTVGMTKEQVTASLGKPGYQDVLSDPRGTVDVWNYYNKNYLYFYKDKLVYWTQTSNVFPGLNNI